MFNSALERFMTNGVAFAETRHEFAVSFRVVGVSVARLWHNARKPGLQRFHHTPPDFILHFEDILHHEVVLLRKGDLLSYPIEELNRDAPAGAYLLNVSLQNVTHSQITIRLGGVGSCVVHDLRGWEYREILVPPEHGNQRIRKTQ
jgi:hypothetical protein